MAGSAVEVDSGQSGHHVGGVLPYLLAGISVGGQYALIAIGYSMVYGILRLINFAHGDVFMVAGLLGICLLGPQLAFWTVSSSQAPALVECLI